MRACRRLDSRPEPWGADVAMPSSSTGMTRQLLKMGKSSPRLSSVTLISSRKSGREAPFRARVNDVKIASSC